MNDKNSFPWNYKIVFQIPPDIYFTTLKVGAPDPTPDVESKLDAMHEYRDALAVINRIKSL